MPKPTYTLQAQLTYNAWTDLTSDWLIAAPLIIERGLTPGGRVARIGRMTLALYNPDGRYTPGHASATAGFEVGIGIRLRASDGVDTWTLFAGRLAAVTPRQSVAGRSPLPGKSVQITVEDDMAALERSPVAVFPLWLDAAPGDLVEVLISRSFVPFGRDGFWRLDHAQAGLLGQGTTLSGAATGVSLDAGQSVFPWAGDGWPEDRPAAEALREVCASEGGTFFIAADGTPTFADRHARLKHLDAEAELDGGLRGLTVERDADRLANRVAVTVYPRDVGTENVVLWEAGQNVIIPPGEVRTITCRYRDPDQQVAAVGALSVVRPEAGVDFTATNKADGTGANRIEQVRVAMTAGGAAAELTLWATTSERIYVHDLQLRGVPMRAFFPVTTVAEDGASLLTYGRHVLAVDMPLQADTGVANDQARALLIANADPRGWLTVHLEATADADLLAHALARDVGDRLHLTDAALALDGSACFIDGVRHEIRRGGASHRVMWTTSPAGDALWALGSTPQAALGTGTHLAY